MTLVSRKRITSLALGVAFVGASLAIPPPAQAESVDLEAEMATSLQEAVDGLLTEVEVKRYFEDGRLSEIVPSITEIKFTLGGTKQPVKGKGRPYSYEESERPSPYAKKLTKSIHQGVAPSTREGGSWIRRDNISARTILPQDVARADADTIITNVQQSRALQQQVESIDGMTLQEKAQSLVRLPLTFGAVEPGSVLVREYNRGFEPPSFFDKVMVWSTEEHVNQYGETCYRTRVRTYFKSGYLAQWVVDQDCSSQTGRQFSYKAVGNIFGYGSGVSNEGPAPQPRLNYQN